MITQRSYLLCGSALLLLAACTGSGGDRTQSEQFGVSQQKLSASSKSYTTNADFDLGTSSGLNHNTADQLQLDTRAEVEPFMYLSQTYEGVLLKVDTRTGRQVARYYTTRTADCPTCGATGNWYPSRTAVDLNGNVWVANRAFGVQGSITKIAGSLAECVDRNSNGTIETSRDANNDGLIDTNDPLEFLGQSDECVIRSIPVGGPDAVLRALALDESGHLWVGGYNTQRAYEVDPESGTVLRDFSLGTTPYGFVRKGKYLYSAALGNPVVRIDVTTNPVTVKQMYAPNNYGITVDRDGVGWFGSYGGGIYRCDFEATSSNCQGFAGPGFRGLTVDADGQIWAASPDSGLVAKYSASGVLLGTTSCPGQNPYGVAVGHDGAIWSAAYYGALRIEPGPIGGAPGACQAFSTAHLNGSQPMNYTYSDFTGFQLRNVTVQQGTWTIVHDGLVNATTWGGVRWNAEPQGLLPAGTLIKAEVRAADDLAQLGALGYLEVQNGLSFREQGIVGRYIQSRITLRNLDTSIRQTPVLSDVTIEPANRAPTAACRPVTLVANDTCGAVVNPSDLDNGSTDPDGDSLSLGVSPASPYPIGSTPVVLTVADGNGATSSCESVVTVLAASELQPGGDSIVSTQGAASANVTLTATLLGETGYTFADEVNFGLSAELLTPMQTSAMSVNGIAVAGVNLVPGIYDVTMTATCSAASANSIVVVYNPEGGFATGGGWIIPANDGLNTHPGARANFGFNAKYKAGNPTGNLMFRYSDGYMDLKSQSVTQLVISGGKMVQFKGTAIVNGTDGYNYFVKGIDNGEPGTNDEFDIKVWAPGVSVDADPSQRAGGILGGGNIVVHTN